MIILMNCVFLLLNQFKSSYVLAFLCLQQISGNCNTTILHTPERYSYLYSYDCTLVPGKTPGVSMQIPLSAALKHSVVWSTSPVRTWTPWCIQNSLNGQQGPQCPSGLCKDGSADMDWKVMIVKAGREQWSHSHVRETSLTWSDLCGITVCCPALSSNEIIGPLCSQRRRHDHHNTSGAWTPLSWQ